MNAKKRLNGRNDFRAVNQLEQSSQRVGFQAVFSSDKADARLRTRSCNGKRPKVWNLFQPRCQRLG